MTPPSDLRKPTLIKALQTAISLHRQGRLDEAEHFYRRVLKRDRNQITALQNLGRIRLIQGEPNEAVTLLQKTLNQMPDSPEAHLDLGLAFAGIGHHKEAIQSFEKAISLNPEFTRAHSNLGFALQAVGRHNDAIAHFERAVSLAPEQAEVHSNLGNALQMLGRQTEAIMHYEKAVALKPDFAEAHSNLAWALRADNRREEAIQQFRKAIQMKPNYVSPYLNLATVLRDKSRYEEAIACYEQAIAIKPDSDKAYAQLGRTLVELGRIEEAHRVFDKGRKVAPQKINIYGAMADSHRFVVGDPLLAEMEELAKRKDALAEQDQILMHFALAKAYSDVVEHERSFRHLLAGNALKRRQINYDETETLGFFERIQSTFTPELMAKPRRGNPSEVPIFVLGMPRSGTTLFEQILASHPKVFGAGELTEFGDQVGKLSAERGCFPEVASALSAEQLQQLGARYVDRIKPLAPGAERIIDKMPTNFCFVGLIHITLPKARIIHTRRDPVDTCLSCFSKLFAGDLPYAYELGELGRYYRAYERLMQHWREVLPEGAMLEVQYEALIADLEGQARRIVAYCGLEWSDMCLSFHRTQRPVQTASASQVRQPIYSSSVGRSRAYRDRLRPLFEGLNIDDDG